MNYLRKSLVLIVMNLIVITSFSQIYTKEVNLEGELYFELKMTQPVNGQKVVQVFQNSESVGIFLYDKDFNKIKEFNYSKKHKGEDASFKLTLDFLYVIEDNGEGVDLAQIKLDKGMKTQEYYLPSFSFYGLKEVSINDKYFFYEGSSKSENSYLSRLNLNTKEEVIIKSGTVDSQKARAMSVETFLGDERLIVHRWTYTKEKKKAITIKDEFVIYDASGNDQIIIPRMDGENYKADLHSSLVNENIITVGNYKNKPAKYEIAMGGESSRKPNFTGIYIRNFDSNKSFEKFYPFTSFKGFTAQIKKDLKTSKLPKFSFNVEGVYEQEEGSVVVGSIAETAFFSSQSGGKYSDGKNFYYVFMFGLNKEGDILWDKTIPLEPFKYIESPNSSSIYMNNYEFIGVVEEEGGLKCHYSNFEGLFSFSIVNGEIVNMNEVKYFDKENLKNKIKYQYEYSKHWYDNFYFSYYRILENSKHFKLNHKKSEDSWYFFDRVNTNK